MSQSLLNEVKYSNAKIFKIGESMNEVAIPFKWGQVFQPRQHVSQELRMDVVAIPFKWGQVFQREPEELNIIDSVQSQSLLNEVKYSNKNVIRITAYYYSNVAIPFKWGQVFQLIAVAFGWVFMAGVAIPFKWGQVFQLWTIVQTTINITIVAIPFKWGQVFQRQAL